MYNGKAPAPTPIVARYRILFKKSKYLKRPGILARSHLMFEMEGAVLIVC
jgi:hypothetical protein